MKAKLRGRLSLKPSYINSNSAGRNNFRVECEQTGANPEETLREDRKDRALRYWSTEFPSEVHIDFLSRTGSKIHLRFDSKYRHVIRMGVLRTFCVRSLTNCDYHASIDLKL